ncbi:MAG: hypothetical protein ACRDT6_29005, partial [Micromonosporaceae bacterium]
MADLTRELRQLGHDLAGEPPEGLAEAVLNRIADEPPPRPPWWRRHWRAMLTGLVALLAVALLAPPVRATVAEWFAFAGVVVRPDTGSAPS